MGDVLNRSTLEVLRSVNPPDYPEPTWIDLDAPTRDAIEAIDRRYRKITGDLVSEMDAGEKAAVDAQSLTAQAAAEVAELDAGTLRRFVLVLLDEINALRARAVLSARTLDQLKSAMRGK